MNFEDIKVISFACYGTLIDWDYGVQLAQLAVLADKSGSVDIETFQQRWEEEHFQVMLKPWQPYRDCLRQGLRATLEYFGESYAAADGDRFVASVTEWMPFLGAQATLNRLKSAYKLAVLSNADNDLVKESLTRQLGVEFDWQISAEDLKVHKPHRAFFEGAQRILGVEPRQILHVAHGMRYDMTPALQLGWGTMWVNRRSEGLGDVRQPDHTVIDLHELSDLIPA
jgi:2-haloalkanoic acid dehalogenase type II